MADSCGVRPYSHIRDHPDKVPLSFTAGISKSAKKRSNQKQRLGGQRSTSDSDLAGSIANALAQSSSTPNFQVHILTRPHAPRYLLLTLSMSQEREYELRTFLFKL